MPTVPDRSPLNLPPMLTCRLLSDKQVCLTAQAFDMYIVLCVQVVARVQGLTMLNGSAVRQRERRDCELRYLRAITGMPILLAFAPK